ncbi:MAG: leucine-rich repeat protein [Clostridia bacterium]|nr:leucine-rich repeat protein [Clostridia bacterium]
MKKRVLSLILAMLLLPSLCLFTACSDEKSSSNSSYYYPDYDYDYEETETSSPDGEVPVDSISFSADTYYLYVVGDQKTLNPKILPSNATDKSLEYESFGDAITCSDDGVVTAVKSGTAYVIATASNGKFAKVTFKVIIDDEPDDSTETSSPEGEILPISISLNMNTVSMKIGESVDLTATILPSNATNKEITWISSNTSIARIDEGVITAVSSGTATITAITENGKEATCVVTVIDPIALDFRFESYGNGYAVVEYTGTSDTVTVPSTYNGKNVIAIGTKGKNDGFYQNSDVKTIVLPNTIKDINENAFFGCILLQNITIPSCTTIGNKVFENCKSLKEITLPSGILLFGDELFTGCSKLESITINGGDIGEKTLLGPTNVKTVAFGKDVTTIAEGALSGYSSLTTLTIPFVGGDDSSQGSAKGVLGYIFGTTDYSGSYSVSTFSKKFYIPSLLKDITITGGAIGEKAFYYCSKITSVTIGNSVTEIGYQAFCQCDSLTSVTIGNSVTSIGSSAFFYCDSLTSVTIPDSVTSIGSSAFYYCDSLTSVTIGEGVTSIGSSAFYGCLNIVEINLNAKKLTQAEEAFAYASGTLKIGKNVSNIPASMCAPIYGGGFSVNGQGSLGKDYYCCIEKVVFESGSVCKTIGDSAFENCRSLSSVNIPDSVKTIGDEAFIGCSSLTSVTIGNSVTEIGSDAFRGCTNIKEATIPTVAISSIPKNYLQTVVINGGDAIGNSAFANCTYLTSVTIGNSVTEIGSDAFQYCTNIKEATIPTVAIPYIPHDSLQTVVINGGDVIGDDAFKNCTSLTSVTIGDGVTTIGAFAFRGCSSLKSVYIPNSVKTIGDYAFAFCTSLTIYCEATRRPDGCSYYWNYSNCPVVLGHSHSYTDGKCICGKVQ